MEIKVFNDEFYRQRSLTAEKCGYSSYCYLELFDFYKTYYYGILAYISMMFGSIDDLFEYGYPGYIDGIYWL